jgi:hypothetical protein
MSNLPDRYAWCFSHGLMHTFDPEAPWCTASWVWLSSRDKDDALADKQQRYGDAEFLHQLPADEQLAVIGLVAENPTP